MQLTNNNHYVHMYNDFKEDGITIKYDDNKHALLEFTSIEKLIANFPNYSFLVKEKFLETYVIDKINCNDSENYKVYESYKQLALLDEIIALLSLDRQKVSLRSYAYELYNTKKIIIKNSVSFTSLKNLDHDFFIQLAFIHERLIALNKPQLELEKSFLSKAIEDTIKRNKIQSNIVSYDILISYFIEICEEHELLSKAYLDNLDTNSMRFDYQKKVQEINEKLQSILSDIQNKLLIPPIALIIAIANIYDKPNVVQNLTMLVLFSFFLLVGLYSYNQYKILENYLLSLKNWKIFYMKFLSKNFKILEKNFSNIENIATNIQNTIILSSVINILLYILAFAFLI